MKRKLYTYEVFTNKVSPGTRIGWRKTGKRAGEFASELLAFGYQTVVISRREREKGDFGKFNKSQME